MYLKQGGWQEAEQLLVQTMETRKTNFGVEHPETPICMAYVASAWKNLGHNSKAIDLIQACAAQQHRTLSSKYPHTSVWNVVGLENGGLKIHAIQYIFFHNMLTVRTIPWV
ncbi:hypothetical protein N7488_008959 [Penicillium malachiteum]|nr:hypothetical protein N7488_008959 [Penicillium malachiteum]